jgi:two-component system, OmpR family, sensor histidine kinase KdpD
MRPSEEMTTNRADSFLHLIRRSQRGRLKIYLGYCAGVGKTYQMLLEANRLLESGVDVAVGLVETHGREETEALLKGLEIIPRKKTVYRGIEINEMDLDAILLRRPEVVLVDELAHTNVPGSKNAKRYQDVEEIIAAGVHVISTLNVQHLESLYETVERATRIKVRERIPDRVVAEADQIVDVDITTEDLRQRLREGKVYTKERVETALEGFFKPSNLGQLRELTLRELAAQIDSRRREPLEEENPYSPDQVMVCLSSRGPNSGALLRYGSRLAGRLNRNWYAVYVQTTSERPTVIDSETQRVLTNTLTLAQQLGATVFTYRGDDIVKTLIQFAKEYRVGHMIIGMPARRMSLWQRLRGKGSIVERLIRESSGLTVVVLDTRDIGEDRAGVLETPPAKDQPLSPLANLGVLMWNGPLEKESAIRDLIDACSLERTEFREAAWHAILEREKQGGTFVGEHVALPHARIQGLEQPYVCLGVGKSGIQDTDTGRDVRIMILLLSPPDPPEKYLESLATISRMASDDSWRKKVISARTIEDIDRVTRSWEQAHLLEAHP